MKTAFGHTTHDQVLSIRAQAPLGACALFAAALSLVVAVLLSVFLLATPISASAEDGLFAGGTGTETDPYQIANADQLKNLADQVNAGSAQYATAHYALTGNIDLAGSRFSSANTRIGYADSFRDASNHGFRGTFDGGGFTIKNVKLDLSTLTSKNGMYTAGLFGATQGATIKNLNLQTVTLSGTLSEAPSVDVALGCLVGAAFGSTNIDQCSVMNGMIEELTPAGTTTNTRLYAAGGLVGDAYTTGSGANASITNCSVDCTIQTTGTYSSQSYAGGIVGRSRVNSNEGGWLPVQVNSCAFAGSIKADGYNAPVIAGVRRGAGTNAATGTNISTAVTFNMCFYQAKLSMNDGTMPNSVYNLTQSDDVSQGFVYDEAGAYRWGDDKLSGSYSAANIADCKATLDPGGVTWRQASKNGVPILVLNHVSVGITLDEPLHGRYYLSEGYFGVYEGETGASLENPAWSTNVNVTAEGRHFVTLAPDAQEASVAFGSNRQQASCVIPAPSDVFVAVQRVNNNAGRVVSLSAVIVNGDAWGLNTDDFTYEWFEGSIASGGVISTESSLDVSSAPVGAKFTVKATLVANNALTFQATGAAGGRTVFVDANAGDDNAKGTSPDTAVRTIPRAYELLDEHGTVESNVIVIVGEYNDSSFGLEQQNGKPNAFYKPATITGYDAGYPEASKGTNSLSGDDARFNDYGRLTWHNDEARGKFLYADTAIRDIVLYGGGGNVGYIYCQGHNLTMDENIKMYGYSQASTDNFGLLAGTNVPNFHLVGGYYDKQDSATGQKQGDECTITVKSGCYARILAGNRNTKMNDGSHNTLGSETDYFKSKIVVDIQQPSRGGYNCDVGMLCGGQTDGSVFAVSDVELNSGYVKLFLGSSIGYNRSTGDERYSNNDFVGLVRATVNGGTVEQLYGGCLGRWSNSSSASKDLGIDSHYRHSDAIRKKEGLDASQPDILITINGGTVGTSDATGAVFASGAGGTTGTAEDPASVAVAVNGGTINGSVYGGGDGKTTTGNATTACATAGMLYGSASVSVADGTVTGSVYGGGAGTDAYLTNVDKRALAQVIGDTEVSVTGGIVNGSVYGGGNGIESKDAPHMARVTGNTYVSVSGGQVGGSVYGGGARGTVGEGTVGGNGRLPYEVTSAGSTTVVVSGGAVAGSVFGGGEGFGQGDTDQALIKGAVFGTSTVKVYGGSIKDDVFGGGNESRTYAPAVDGTATQATLVIVNSTDEGIAVLPETDAQDAGKVVSNDTEAARIVDDLCDLGEGAAASRTVDLGGSVFGGGNRSKQSGSGQANDYTVYGNTEVFVKGSGVSFGGESGGVYGDGNVSKAFGTRHITLIDFKNDAPDADPLKMFYSLQRADRAIMSNSKVYTLGALDRVNSLDSTKYAVNRVQLLKLYNGSTLQLDTVVNGLGSLWSDVETERDFRKDDWMEKKDASGHKVKELDQYRQAYEQGTLWTSLATGTAFQALNTVIINNGKQLDVAYADDEQPETGKYGHVIGLFTLSLLTPGENEGGAFVFAATGTDTQAFNPDSTGHFACVTKEYEDGEEEDDYLDLRTQQLNGNRIWYVEGHTYQYDLTIKGYTTGNTTVTAQAWLPVNEREDDENGKDCYLQFDSRKDIAIENTPELVGEGVTPGEKQAQLRMDVNTNAGESLGGYYYFQNPGRAPDDRFRYDENEKLIPVTFSLTLGQNMTAVNDGLVTFQLRDMNEDEDMNTYLFRVHIIIESPTSDGYALKHYGKIYGDVPYTTTDTITSKSAYTAEFISTYSPSAYSGKSWSIIPYWDGNIAEHSAGQTSQGPDWYSRFSPGLKITMIDLTNANNPQYYYHECEGETEINLDSFDKVNGSGKFSDTKSGNTVIREKLVFIVDYENAENKPEHTQKFLMLKHTYNNGANDILRYTEYNQDGSVFNEHYAPGVEQQIEYESSTTGFSKASLTAGPRVTSLDYLYDVYHFDFSLKLNDAVKNTRFEENEFSVILWLERAKNLPLGTSIIVTDASGRPIDSRYVRMNMSNDEERAGIVANIKEAGDYHIALQVSRYLTYGRFSSVWGATLRANVYSSSNGLYPYGNVGKVNIGESSWIGQWTDMNPKLPSPVYNLKVDSITAADKTVTAQLFASKKVQNEAEDLAPYNGLTVWRSLKGNAASAVNVTAGVTPAQGKATGTMDFTLTDTVPGPGTYEYTFFYGTTVETKTVTVG
ncbi:MULTISPECIES: hypothetical protein [Gordonibacter]|uniref:Cna B-type domain-containing protein n=1 Tax=Gordonibacter faecis TaxID=3047475 RepID=A0ABT7DK72_9ACTN|nr:MULTISPECIES: hypothetical protein [unclassified Gordonibacter]MDJ1649930.1 hypothetical protein [Gordonibacter sp. KGMB12511]